MRKILSFICFIAVVNVCFAQADAAEKYAAEITGKNLEKHLISTSEAA